MYKTIFSHLGKYKKQAILTPLMIIGEVAMEVTIPAVMALIIDNGVKQGRYRLCCENGRSYDAHGYAFTGFRCCRCPFQCGLLYGICQKPQKIPIPQGSGLLPPNVDKFSTASLTTRLTTDVTKYPERIYDVYKNGIPFTHNAHKCDLYGSLRQPRSFKSLYLLYPRTRSLCIDDNNEGSSEIREDAQKV